MSLAVTMPGSDDEEIQTSLRMSKNLLKRAKRYAIDNDKSFAAVAVEALEEYLKRKNY
jgi:predicted transcriptional regulator